MPERGSLWKVGRGRTSGTASIPRGEHRRGAGPCPVHAQGVTYPRIGSGQMVAGGSISMLLLACVTGIRQPCPQVVMTDCSSEGRDICSYLLNSHCSVGEFGKAWTGGRAREQPSAVSTDPTGPHFCVILNFSKWKDHTSVFSHGRTNRVEWLCQKLIFSKGQGIQCP